MPLQSRFERRSAPGSLAWAAMIALLTAAPAGAQTRPPADATEQAPPAQRRAAGPLMREGSFLTAVQGRVHQDLRTGWWSFTTDSSGDATDESEESSGEAAPGQPPAGLELILLPNSKLEDIKQVIDATEEADEDLVFEISGRLFVYHGRNFLLATHAPQLIAYRPPRKQRATKRIRRPPSRGRTTSRTSWRNWPGTSARSTGAPGRSTKTASAPSA